MMKTKYEPLTETLEEVETCHLFYCEHRYGVVGWHKPTTKQYPRAVEWPVRNARKKA